MGNYCISRFNSVRTPTREVSVGNVKIGGNNHIVVQSMTNTKTCDVEASVKQCIQLAEAGCEIVRLTAQNLDAARALKDISKKFRAAGFDTPLVADIHFLPQTAMEAVEHVEKIRVNPGNFTDKKIDGKTEYTDAEYEAELEKVRAKFEPLVLRCKELGRAIRIGTNHGSLSDRIRLRYGDTPYGMVEAAFEFARICRDLNFHNFLFSFKASNTRVMTQAYRLAAKRMKEEGFSYPLHLGVTEAGFGIDARIKSSMGIGGLLFDGLGDTIRVSLTEDPVQEIPVAQDLARLAEKIRAERAVAQKDEGIDFYNYNRRETTSLAGGKIGASAVPAVASFGKSDKADFSSKTERRTSAEKLKSANTQRPKHSPPTCPTERQSPRKSRPPTSRNSPTPHGTQRSCLSRPRPPTQGTRSARRECSRQPFAKTRLKIRSGSNSTKANSRINPPTNSPNSTRRRFT